MRPQQVRQVCDFEGCYFMERCRAASAVLARQVKQAKRKIQVTQYECPSVEGSEHASFSHN
jgi:hypothetical protein